MGFEDFRKIGQSIINEREIRLHLEKTQVTRIPDGK